MASLTQLTLSAAMQWQLARSNAGFADTKQGSNLSYSQTLTGFATWTQLFAQQMTIANGSFNEFSLSTFTNALGTAVTAGHILAICIVPTGAGALCSVTPGVTNGLVWYWTGTSPALAVPINGVEYHTEDPAGTGTVLDATHNTLRITNAGTAPLTVSVAAVVGP